ncbi:MAG: YncE family protein [Alphaproteobacteria bacterium]
MQRASILAVAMASAAILSAPAVGSERIYVPLGSDDAIVVIDPAIDAVVDRIDNISSVHGLAATPDGRFLVAGRFDEWEAGTVETKKPVGVTEDEHAAHHSMDPARPGATGAPVVSTVSIIDVETGLIVRRVDVPGAVHHVSIDPNGRYAALTQPNQDAITILDLASFQVVATIPTGALPNYAVFSPDGQHVYVSNAGNNTVSDVTVDGWIVSRNLIVGETPEHVVLSDDGGSLYVNNIETGTVSVIDTRSWSVADTFAAGDLLHGIGLSDDGKTIFVAARNDDALTVIDLDSGRSASVTLSPAPYHVATIKGLGKLYISSAEQPKIWVVDQQTGSILGEIEIGGKGHQMAQVSG